MLRGTLALLPFALGVTVLAPSAMVPPARAGEPCSLCAGGEYHPVDPVRIFDSRPSVGHPNGINGVAPFGAKPTNTSMPTFDVQLLGALADTPDNPIASLTANDVLALMVSITVVNPTRMGWLGAYPKGEAPASPTSLLNFNPGMTVPNLAIVRPGADGRLTVQMWTDLPGTADVLIDLQGWFSTSQYPVASDVDRGARLIPVSPGRLLETRSQYGGAGALTAGETRMLDIKGATTVSSPIVTGLVPDDDDIVGVLLNVTSILPTGAAFVSVLPEHPVGMPTTSNLNLIPGTTKANLVAVKLGTAGEIYLYNHFGRTDLAVDVVGYFEKVPDETRRGRVVPLSKPFRALDTRLTSFGAVSLGPGQAEDWSFAAFASSVNIDSVSLGEQLGLIGNLTLAQASRQYPTVAVSGFMTAYPSVGGSLPVVSNLNTMEGLPIPNMALFMYGPDQKVTVFNWSGYVHYLFDASAVVLADPA